MSRRARFASLRPSFLGVALAAVTLLVAMLAAGGKMRGARAPSRTEEPRIEPTTGAVRAPSGPRLGELPGRIVFVSERDHNREIYALIPATGALSRLTRDAEADYPVAAWSDGASLLTVHASADDALEHVEELRLLKDGSAKPLAAASRRVRNPALLPSGEAVVFEASYEGFSDLFLLSARRGEPERLTHAPEGSFEPAVDPSGDALAFVSSRGGDVEIYRLELATREMLRLTWSPGDDVSPTFSPDGRTLAFVSSRTGTPMVHLMQANGSRPRALRPPDEAGLEQRAPRFSPDGRSLAFVEQGGGRAGLRLVRVSDGALLVSTDGDWIDQAPVFSPDGCYLAFASDRAGDTELYAMAVSSGEALRLTRAPGADWLPRWMAH